MITREGGDQSIYKINRKNYYVITREGGYQSIYKINKKNDVIVTDRDRGVQAR